MLVGRLNGILFCKFWFINSKVSARSFNFRPRRGRELEMIDGNGQFWQHDWFNHFVFIWTWKRPAIAGLEIINFCLVHFTCFFSRRSRVQARKTVPVKSLFTQTDNDWMFLFFSLDSIRVRIFPALIYQLILCFFTLSFARTRTVVYSSGRLSPICLHVWQPKQSLRLFRWLPARRAGQDMRRRWVNDVQNALFPA